jgi:hypothetical protein
MKKTFKLQAINRIAPIISLAAAIALSLAACDLVGSLVSTGSSPASGGPSSGSPSGGSPAGGAAGAGTFTLSGIPSQYNGKYALLMGEGNDEMLFGCQSINASTGAMTLALISGGSVNIPLWQIGEPDLTAYSGSQTLQVLVAIVDTPAIADGFNNDDLAARRYFSSVAFSNGGAAKAWGDGADYDLSTGGEGGSFTLIGIPPEYDGKWAYLSGGYDYYLTGVRLELIGIQSVTANTMVLAPVSNGSVIIPVWLVSGSSFFPDITGYYGDDTVDVTVVIANTASITNGSTNDDNAPLAAMRFSSVAFSNGSASAAWSQGEEVDLSDVGGSGEGGGSEGEGGGGPTYPVEPAGGDPAGTWVSSAGDQMILTNGSWKYYKDEDEVVRGTYTTSSGGITFNVTELWGSFLFAYLNARWYTKEELTAAGFPASAFTIEGSHSGSTLSITWWDGQPLTFTKQ